MKETRDTRAHEGFLGSVFSHLELLRKQVSFPIRKVFVSQSSLQNEKAVPELFPGAA